MKQQSGDTSSQTPGLLNQHSEHSSQRESSHSHWTEGKWEGKREAKAGPLCTQVNLSLKLDYQGYQGPKKSVLLYVRGGVGVLLPLRIAACEVQEWL